MKNRTGLLLSFASLITMSACTQKNQSETFKVIDGPISYQHKKFEDPQVLFEANGKKYLKSQILDKSVVLTDLDTQENVALLAKVLEKVELEKLGDKELTVYLPAPKDELADVLRLYGVNLTRTPKITYAAGEDNQIIARIGDTTWNRSDFKKADALFSELEKRRIEEISRQINSQLSRILVNEASIAAKTPIQNYVKNEINKGEAVKVNDEEMAQSLLQMGLKIADIDPQAKERVRSGLIERKQQRLIEAYAQETLLKGPISVAFEKPNLKISLDKNWKPIAGYEDAPVEVVAFSSADCADCKNLVKNLSAVVAQNDGHLKVNWVHAVHSQSGLSHLIAESALCLESQKNGSTLSFLQDIAPKAESTDESTYGKWAKSHGLSDEKMRDCLLQGKQKNLLEKHAQYADAMGIRQSPTLWVSGQFLSVNSTFEQIQKAIDLEKERLGSSWIEAKYRQIKNKLGI